MSIRPLLAAVLCLAAVSAGAHPEEQGAKYALIDCDHPAPQLATALPEALAGRAMLECTPAFHQIVAGEGWIWRYPGSYFARPFIPAYAPLPSQGMGGVRYFTAFEATELSPSEIDREHERFRSIVTYRQEQPPARILKVVATNDLGHALDAYFGFRSEREGWAVICTPECAPNDLFVIEKQD